MHQRRVLRDFAAARIAAGVAAFGLESEPTIQDDNPAVGDSRVYRSREAPANFESILKDGPMVNIYARKDHIKAEDYPKSGFDSGVRRTLELAVEITAMGVWAVDDKLDALAESIETLMEQDFEVPGLPSAEFRLTSTDIDSSDAFDQPLGGALMLYEVSYWRPYRTDTSEENKICEVYARGPDGIVAQVGECDGVCEPGPV
jgi:hypothetical protein